MATESKRDLVAEARHRALHTTSRVESAGLDELADALDAAQKTLARVETLRGKWEFELGGFVDAEMQLRKALAEPSVPNDDPLKVATAKLDAAADLADGWIESAKRPDMQFTDFAYFGSKLARILSGTRIRADSHPPLVSERMSTAVEAIRKLNLEWGYGKHASQGFSETLSHIIAEALAEPSEQAACDHHWTSTDKGRACGKCWAIEPEPATTATTGDFNNRLLRLEGIVLRPAPATRERLELESAVTHAVYEAQKNDFHLATDWFAIMRALRELWKADIEAAARGDQ